MQKSGAERIKFKNQKTAAQEERYGLELEEYEQMMAAPGSTDLSLLENDQTRVVAELMRWGCVSPTRTSSTIRKSSVTRKVTAGTPTSFKRKPKNGASARYPNMWWNC
jgi:putative SOS response-associated peptidase YedK